MHRPIRGMVLLLLAAVLACQAEGQVTVIPASEDVYINMGKDSLSVFNQSELLLCSIDVLENNQTGSNLSREISYPGMPVIQFNISDLNISQDDMAVLLLKAESISKGVDPVMVALLTMGSNWHESSDYTTFLVNILTAWNAAKDNDATAYGSNTDGDAVFAFDVSKKLQDARTKGERISFLLQAFSNSSAEMAFFSRESGMGPCLVIMPYPQTDGIAGADVAGMEEIPETMLSIANISSTLPSSGMNRTIQSGNLSQELQSGNASRNLQLGDVDSILQSRDMRGSFNLSDLIDGEEMIRLNLTV